VTEIGVGHAVGVLKVNVLKNEQLEPFQIGCTYSPSLVFFKTEVRIWGRVSVCVFVLCWSLERHVLAQEQAYEIEPTVTCRNSMICIR